MRNEETNEEDTVPTVIETEIREETTEPEDIKATALSSAAAKEEPPFAGYAKHMDTTWTTAPTTHSTTDSPTSPTIPNAFQQRRLQHDLITEHTTASCPASSDSHGN